jgi:hypothetical protein
MMKSIATAVAALALLAGSAAMAKGDAKKGEHKKHKSTAHTCLKDGAEIKKGDKKVRREKTCASLGGTWTLNEDMKKGDAKPAGETPAAAKP